MLLLACSKIGDLMGCSPAFRFHAAVIITNVLITLHRQSNTKLSHKLHKHDEITSLIVSGSCGTPFSRPKLKLPGDPRRAVTTKLVISRFLSMLTQPESFRRFFQVSGSGHEKKNQSLCKMNKKNTEALFELTDFMSFAFDCFILTMNTSSDVIAQRFCSTLATKLNLIVNMEIEYLTKNQYIYIR